MNKEDQMILIDPYRKTPISPLLNKPPLVRKGGKRYLAEQIVGMINTYDYSMYVEPFVGGGRIYFEKDPHFEEILNDREERIANFFYCAKHFPEEMMMEQATLVKDENIFYRIYDKYHDATQLEQIRNDIKNAYTILSNPSPIMVHEMKNPKSTLVTHAIEFFFYQNMVFRGGDARTMTYFENDPRTEKNRLRYRIYRPLLWLSERMRRTQVLNKDFKDIFQIALNYENHSRIWYLDPPYFETDGYEYPFPWEQYEILNMKLKELPKSDYFILSLNIREEFDDLFDWCKIEKVTTRYTTGGAGQSKNVEEYLITPPWSPKLKMRKGICQKCQFFAEGQNSCKYCKDITKKLTFDSNCCMFYTMYGQIGDA